MSGDGLGQGTELQTEKEDEALTNLPRQNCRLGGKYGSKQSRQVPHWLSSVEVPAGAGIEAGVLPVSLFMADLLGNRQTVRNGRGAGLRNLPQWSCKPEGRQGCCRADRSCISWDLWGSQLGQVLVQVLTCVPGCGRPPGRQAVCVLVKADFLGDRQAVGYLRGAVTLDLPWMELFDFQITREVLEGLEH